MRLFFPHAGTAANAWMAHVAEATAVAISPDGARIAIGTADGAISLWSSADARQLGIVPAELRHTGAVLDFDNARPRQKAGARAGWGGALVAVAWPRHMFESKGESS